MDFPLLQRVVWHNPVQDYLIALLILAALWAVLRIIRSVALSRLRELAARTETTFDDFVVEACERALMPLLNFGAFYFATTFLSCRPAPRAGSGPPRPCCWSSSASGSS